MFYNYPAYVLKDWGSLEGLPAKPNIVVNHEQPANLKSVNVDLTGSSVEYVRYHVKLQK